MFKSIGNGIGSLLYSVGEGIEYVGNCVKELGDYLCSPPEPPKKEEEEGPKEVMPEL